MPPKEHSQPEAVDVNAQPSQTYIDNRRVYNVTTAKPEELERALARFERVTPDDDEDD